MAAKITVPILPRAFELIRTRIVTILKEELAAQNILQPTIDFSANVFEEMSTPVDVSQGSVVIVRLESDNFDSFTQRDSSGQNNFFIDVYAQAKSTDATRGDTASRILTQRFLGVIAGILGAAQYKTLDFAPGFIGRNNVTNITMSDPDAQNDSTNNSMGRLVLTIQSNDTQIPEGVRDLEEFSVEAKLGEAGKVLKFNYKYPVP